MDYAAYQVGNKVPYLLLLKCSAQWQEICLEYDSRATIYLEYVSIAFIKLATDCHISNVVLIVYFCRLEMISFGRCAKGIG